jgi:Xaa-Pro aminopeptidase
MSVADRLPTAVAALDDAGCDGLLVTELVNIRYLTGFTGSAAQLLVTPDRTLFVTDGRYASQAPKQLAAAGVDAEIVIGLSGEEQRKTLRSAASNLARLGLEADSVSWAQQRTYATTFTSSELVPTTGLVELLRLTKDEGELDRMAAAAAIADAALAELAHLLGEGVTEREFAMALDQRMKELGASAPSFDTIVASGPNGALPHAEPGDRQVEQGDLVVVDFGAVVDGYCSDMTRTFQVGDVGPERRRMWEVVFDAQAAGVDAVRSGVEAKAVDAVCRELIAAAGWGEAFSHGTGHGVGLLIHEEPRVSSASGDTLAAGQVVTVEPGVYLPNLGGVRIEDTLVVTAEGSLPLTRSPKEPVIA